MTNPYPPPGRGRDSFDLDDHPLLAIWQTTQACDLACKHCRDEAMPARNPAELDTADGKHLLEDLAHMGTPLVMLTGGDPTKRPDLAELVRHGAEQGLTMALTPSGTPLMTRALLAELHRAGLARVAVSVDGPDPATHDAFRGVTGSFEHSVRILEDARALGLERELDFTLSRLTLDKLDAMAALAEGLDVSLLRLRVAIPVGRARETLTLSGAELEEALLCLERIRRAAPYEVRTMGAPQRRDESGPILAPHGGAGAASPRWIDVDDGPGSLFVSHVGDVFPSGSLPLRAGNVRAQSLPTIYRASALFRALRDPSRLEGKCAACSFKRLCGGSRARAWISTGNVLAADPACTYEPPNGKAT